MLGHVLSSVRNVRRLAWHDLDAYQFSDLPGLSSGVQRRQGQLPLDAVIETKPLRERGASGMWLKRCCAACHLTRD